MSKKTEQNAYLQLANDVILKQTQLEASRRMWWTSIMVAESRTRDAHLRGAHHIRTLTNNRQDLARALLKLLLSLSGCHVANS